MTTLQLFKTDELKAFVNAQTQPQEPGGMERVIVDFVPPEPGAMPLNLVRKMPTETEPGWSVQVVPIPKAFVMAELPSGDPT